MGMLASRLRGRVEQVCGAHPDCRLDRYAEADVTEYGKTGRGVHDHLFPEF